MRIKYTLVEMYQWNYGIAHLAEKVRLEEWGIGSVYQIDLREDKVGCVDWDSCLYYNGSLNSMGLLRGKLAWT
jgi:hypothetical protein